MYKRFMTLRYLRSRPISYVATFVLALGVAVLLIVTAVMGGFQREFHKKVRGTASDVSVETRSFFGIEAADAIDEQLLAFDHVVGTAPYIENLVVARSFRTYDHAGLRAIDPVREAKISHLEDYILSEREIQALDLERNPLVHAFCEDALAYLEAGGAGREAPGYRALLDRTARQLATDRAAAEGRELAEQDVEGEGMLLDYAAGVYAEASPEQLGVETLFRPVTLPVPPAPIEGQAGDAGAATAPEMRTFHPVVVGAQLYSHLRMRLGDKLTLVSISAPPEEIDPDKIKKEHIRDAEFVVTGVLQSGLYDLDRRTILTTLEAGQAFLGIDGRLSGISVKLDDYRAAEQVAATMRARLMLPGMQVLAWNQRNRTLIEAVKTEQFMIYFIVFFMIVLAGLNLTSILTMGVIEKIKDLGILTSLGATRRGLMSIFLFQGGLIATVGSAVGTGVGLLFVRYINEIDQNVLAPMLGRRVFDPSIYYLDSIPTEVTWNMVLVCVVPTVLLGFVLALYPAYRAARLDPVEALRYE
jgi:lipoprotein-releasing system permease protein